MGPTWLHHHVKHVTRLVGHNVPGMLGFFAHDCIQTSSFFQGRVLTTELCVRACVCVRMGGKHCWSIIVTSNARAEHMAPQKKGEGGPQITGDWKRAIQAVLTDSLLQQPWTDSTRLGCLKGPGAQEATLQTCCSTDRVPAHRSYDTVVTINPCLSLPSSWSRGFHVVPDFNNKKSVCGNKMPTFAHQSFVCKLVLVIAGLFTSLRLRAESSESWRGPAFFNVKDEQKWKCQKN